MKAEGQHLSLIFNLVVLITKCQTLYLEAIQLELHFQRLLYIPVILWDIKRRAIIGRHHGCMVLYTGLNRGKMVFLLQGRSSVALPEANISQLTCP